MIINDLAKPIEIAGGDILVDATLVGKLLDITPGEIPALMRAHAITSLCERGVDVHDGEFRLTFFYRNRRARVNIDKAGRILQRLVGNRTIPRTLDTSGD